MSERAAQIEAEGLKAAIAHLKDLCGEEDASLLADMIEGETTVDAFVGKLIEMILSDEADSDGIKPYQKKLSDRKKRLDNRVARLRVILASVVTELPERKFRHPLASVSVKDVDPKVIITDESLIPTKYFIPVDPKLDETSIRKHLLSRAKALAEIPECNTLEEVNAAFDLRREIDAEFPAIPGATLGNGDITVTIRGN